MTPAGTPPRTYELECVETFLSDIKSENTLFGQVLNYKLCINNNNIFYKINISASCSILAVQLFLWGEVIVFFPCSSSLS